MAVGSASQGIDEFAPARVAQLPRDFEAAVADYAQGDPVIVGYGAECLIAVSGAQATPRGTAELVRYGAGLIFVAMQSQRLQALRIPAMPADHGSRCPNSYVAVDASSGIGTGISALDRAATIRKLSDPDSTPDAFRRPGHVLPVAADLVVGAVATAPQVALMLASLTGIEPAVVAFTALPSVEQPCENATSVEGRRIAERLGRRFIDSQTIATAFYGCR
ncbi:3,4-dihydroxy-2-butanone-4-phosphate synthase [Mycolicibacterium nivoides]|uniref:3,4-dihydroxy-2-butanone-4-phosphate synthase n=1 Tax=Mycolicibacterium nivoides TaxID=2487344 RepID=UPI003C2CCC1B